MTNQNTQNSRLQGSIDLTVVEKPQSCPELYEKQEEACKSTQLLAFFIPKRFV